jgi:hypothetical protein
MTCLLPIAAVLTAAFSAPPDYQQKADAASWDWRPERTGLMYSVLNAPREYDVTVTRPKDTFGDLTIRFGADEKTGYSWQGHLNTQFLVRDKVLYYTDYSPYSDGCAVTAYDLANKKQLWKTNLKALGGIDHTKYHNAVQIDFDGDALRIFGDESAGKYVEYVELKEGKTVGHKVFKD